MNKTLRISATALGLAVTAGLLGACHSLSEEDKNYLESVRTDSRAAADRAEQAADRAQGYAQDAQNAADRAERASQAAAAMESRSVRK